MACSIAVTAVMLGSALVPQGGSAADAPPESPSAPQSAHSNRDLVLEWAEVIEERPDPKVVLLAELRSAIRETGLPWMVRDKASGIELLLVPPGRFEMGRSPDDESLRADELPTHTVRISKAFYLGRCEVTKSQWKRLMGSVPGAEDDVLQPESVAAEASARARRAGYTQEEADVIGRAAADRATKERDYPVGHVSWADCEAFCSKSGLRLPTEAEWEYACRAGKREVVHDSIEELDEVAWHGFNSKQRAHAVGLKAANELGFHDMYGNMREWVADWYGAYSPESQSDPKGPESGMGKVLRGGSWSWMMPATNEHSSYRPSQRSVSQVDYSDDSIGFRVARTVDE